MAGSDYCACACGCGKPVSFVFPDGPFGGRIWYRGYELCWYATNGCMAREESDALRQRARERSA